MSGPTLNRQQSREVDRLAVEHYGMTGLVLMENAGRGVTDRIAAEEIAGPVVICCGRGNNAGDGLVIARHLDLRGHQARVLFWSDPTELTGDAAANLAILQKTDVPIEVLTGDDGSRLADRLSGAAWIVDALLGTGARGEPRPPLDAVIDRLNASGVPILAVDVPSGLDCDTGRPAAHTVRAAVTCTFLTAKTGFFAAGADQYTGRLHVLDIGTPRGLVDRMLREKE